MKKDFKDLDKDFKKLVKEEKLNIGSLEELMIENIENYKRELAIHIEDLLSSEVNEKDLISKKNKNGKKKDSS